MNTTYLLLGANQGDSEQYIADAHKLIEQLIGKILSASPLYKTAAWGKKDQPDFLNQALKISTVLSATALLSQIGKIETTLGRQRTEHWGPRSLDIDILFYNDKIIDRPDLQIPHPQLHLRRFALIPLSAIAAKLVHPIFQKTVIELLQNCTDDLEVSIL